jgi:ankyrin repeat protein
MTRNKSDPSAAAQTLMKYKLLQRDDSSLSNPYLLNENDIFIALIWAIQYGNLEFLQKLFSQFNVEINRMDEFGETPLILACQNKYKDIVDLLLKNGANPNLKNKNQDTPLNIACASGDIPIVQLLLDHHADINGQGKYGDSPLICACKSGYDDVVKLLLQHRSDITISNEDQETAISLANHLGYESIVNLLELSFVL